MSLAILGLGTALPRTAVTLAEALEVARRICCRTPEQAELLLALYRQTGIHTRHLAFGADLVQDILQGTATTGSVFLPRRTADDRGPTVAQRMRHYRDEAAPLALDAARAALRESGLAAQELTHLVTVSCTGFSAPGVDIELIRQLDLVATIQRTHVGFMGCHAAINGLRVAQAYAEAQPAARILVCAVELCALHYHYSWDPKKMVTNALFADGAAALVGAAATTTPGVPWQVLATGSCLFPASGSAMTWNIGDHGFEMTLSTRVPDLIRKYLRPWLEDWLGQHGLGLSDIASWAVHPGGPRILLGVEQALGLTEEATAVSREVLGACGNMSSATLLFVLDRLLRQQAARPCVALGFGPGLVAEAALLG